jgi:hypothetical protein
MARQWRERQIGKRVRAVDVEGPINPADEIDQVVWIDPTRSPLRN